MNAANPSPLATYGPRLLKQGYPIVPIRPGSKHPGFRGWQKTRASQARLDRWLSNGFAAGGVGILTKTIPGVDLDVQDTGLVRQLIAWCDTHIGPTVRRVGQAPKTLLVYRAEVPFAKIASSTYKDKRGRDHKVEILGDGQQFVAFATHPGTGQPYRWISEKSLADLPPEDLPVITEDQARALVTFFESLVPEDWRRVTTAPMSARATPTHDNPVLAHIKPKLDISSAVLRSELTHLDPDMGNQDWCRVGMGLYHQYGGDDEGFELWDTWSATGLKYNAAEMRTRWRSFDADLRSHNPVTAATILHMAKAAREPASPDKDPKQRPPFRLIHAKEVLAKLGPVEWRVQDFLEDNTTGLFFGDPGSFKSFIALDMAFHVAAGKDWHGHPTRPGAVIYIAGEGHGGLARRFAAWERHHGIKLAGLPFYVSEQAAHFYNRESALQVVAAVTAIAETIEPPGLIVIDTLARNFGAGDENSNTDMGLFLNHVDGLLRARFGATVLIVHHTGHSHKERARGAMALKGGMDFEYRIDKVTGLKTRLTCTKMKNAKEPSELWLEGQEVLLMHFEDDDVTSLVFETSTPPVVEEKPLKGKQAALYKIIQEGGPVSRETLREIALAEGIFETVDQIKRALQELKKKEMVVENSMYINTVDSFFATGHTPDMNRTKTSEGEEQNKNEPDMSKMYVLSGSQQDAE